MSTEVYWLGYKKRAIIYETHIIWMWQLNNRTGVICVPTRFGRCVSSNSCFRNSLIIASNVVLSQNEDTEVLPSKDALLGWKQGRDKDTAVLKCGSQNSNHPSPHQKSKFLASRWGGGEGEDVGMSDRNAKTKLICLYMQNNQLQFFSFCKTNNQEYNIKVVKRSWQRITRQNALAEQWILHRTCTLYVS